MKEYPAWMYERKVRTAKMKYDGTIPEYMWTEFKEMVDWAIGIAMKLGVYDYKDLWDILVEGWKSKYYPRWAENWSHQACKVAVRLINRNRAKGITGKPEMRGKYLVICERLYSRKVLKKNGVLKIRKSSDPSLSSHISLRLIKNDDEFWRYLGEKWFKTGEIIVKPDEVIVHYRLLKEKYRPKKMTIFDFLG